ncbi:hypothetical protein, partial [Microbispora triticiradicis]|uniref:hypothetical protein n=1 Tax=Microbispora triticiradicis TaxID=2200763 RepID=UPI001AD65F60
YMLLLTIYCSCVVAAWPTLEAAAGPGRELQLPAVVHVPRPTAAQSGPEEFVVSKAQHNDVRESAAVSPNWRAGVFVVIQVVVVVLLVAGYDLPTTLAVVVGTGLAAGHVIRQVFGPLLPGRDAR